MEIKDRRVTSLWAKKEERASQFYWLPLTTHLTDTMNVCKWLWNNWISDSQRDFCIHSIRPCDAETASNLAAFLGAVHDLGKATPAFQIQKGYSNSPDLDDVLLERLEQNGIRGISTLILADSHRSHHTIAGEFILSHEFSVHDDIGSIIGGHHGKPVDDKLIIEDQSATVIQLWHAAGKIKRSGYSSLGKPDGRDQKVVEILCMHKNYDWIIAGNPRWNQFYCESFNVDRSKLKCLGLPRFDSLLRYEAPMRHRIMKRYPQIKSKPLILYVPTFRRTPSDTWKELIENLDKDKYTVVVKAHPNQPLEKIEDTLDMPEFSSRQLLTAAEYVITDYSSIALEAAALNRKTFTSQ